MTAETWLWNSNLKATQLKMEPPARNTKVFYLLRDYHGGSDGRVWLACSQKGNLSVIKFFKREQDNGVNVNDTALAQKELKYWERCGFSQVFVTKLAMRSALILPFGFHYRDSDVKIDYSWWISSNEPVQCIEHYNSILSLVKDEVAPTVLEACVELCAKNKIIHQDIEWRHVAIFPIIRKPILSRIGTRSNDEPTFELKHAFIDLGRMGHAESFSHAQVAMAERKAILLGKIAF